MTDSDTSDGTHSSDQDSTTNDSGALGRVRARLNATSPRRLALYAVLAAVLVLFLSPLWSGLMTSLKNQTAFATTAPYIPPLPGEMVAQPWFEAWSRLQGGMFNSLLFGIPATIFSALLGSMAAFGLTKIDWRGQLAVLLLFVAGVFIPYQSVLVPLRVFWGMVEIESMMLTAESSVAVLPVLPALFAALAERADLIELMITHTAFGIPICTVLFRGYYLTIDNDILEAAKIDGASTIRVYWRIILPLSKPMFAVTLIYQFTNIWNDLLFALVLVTSSSSHVATQKLNELQGAMVSEYNLQMAGAFLVALPTLIIYVVFGKQFAKGVAGEQ
ncbi:carbohydrate ABC transporter permease [Natronoarchaeum sp. GCM10025703]|uniref:carbohydrate ABC transporter permease n=1 Tax=unclassified Natronoarchaeum TaxID=2620183 RepID=UPI0036162B24